MVRVRIAAGLGALGPIVAAGAALAVGALNPAYDPIHSSVSRLAAVGMRGAVVMDAAIAFLGISLLALALALALRARFGGSTWTVALVAVAGWSFLGAAIIRLDTSAPAVVAVHRMLTGLALGSLTLAPLTTARLPPEAGGSDGYRRISGLIGIAALIGLIAGVGLLVDGFPGGIWERTVAVLTLGWVEVTAVRLLRQPASAPR